jgi:hypothetical protein
MVFFQGLSDGLACHLGVSVEDDGSRYVLPNGRTDIQEKPEEAHIEARASGAGKQPLCRDGINSCRKTFPLRSLTASDTECEDTNSDKREERVRDTAAESMAVLKETPERWSTREG